MGHTMDSTMRDHEHEPLIFTGTTHTSSSKNNFFSKKKEQNHYKTNLKRSSG